jgi:hypothetical protein
MPAIPTPDPAVVHDNALHYLGRSLESIARRDAHEASGGAYFDAGIRYRMLAVSALLARADRRRFTAFLRKSGLLRRHFLRLVAAGHAARRDQFCASLDLPFIDALAAGDLDTAAALAAAAPAQHAADVEYEEDFLRTRFLQLLTLRWHGGAAVDLAPLLARWDEVLEGGDDPHLAVCRALERGDPGSLHRALGRLVQVRAEKVARWREDFSLEPELRSTESAIYLPVLAVLRLADLAGIPTQPDYPYAPSLARRAVPIALDPDSWRDPLAGI